MFISLRALRAANPANVIRLAHFAGMVTYGMLLEDIISELHIKINWG